MALKRRNTSHFPSQRVWVAAFGIVLIFLCIPHHHEERLTLREAFAKYFSPHFETVFGIDSLDKMMHVCKPRMKTPFDVSTIFDGGFIYLSQVHSKARIISNIIDDVEYKVVLTFGINEPGMVYFPDSNYMHGRNLLLCLLFDFEAQMQKYFNYIMFLDLDVLQKNDHVENFETPTLQMQPAIAHYAIKEDQEVDLEHTFDSMMDGYHRSAISYLNYPFTNEYTHKSAWCELHLLWYYAFIHFRTSTIRTGWYIQNGRHEIYTNANSGDKSTTFLNECVRDRFKKENWGLTCSCANEIYKSQNHWPGPGLQNRREGNLTMKDYQPISNSMADSLKAKCNLDCKVE